MTISSTLLAFYTSNLKSFISSPSTFRILRSISPCKPNPPNPPPPTNLTTKPLNTHDAYYIGSSSIDNHKDHGPIPQSSSQALYILDSSFNPPTLAHAHICLSALRDHYASSELQHSKARLLLLLSTKNADKQITGVTLEERLVGMECFAADLLRNWLYTHMAFDHPDRKPAPSSQREYLVPPGPAPEIDIALTSLPYFHDKSAAIEESAIYPHGTTHIHCTGYDTLIRVLNPKYYPPTHDLSPLAPFLSRHKLRVTYRNSDKSSTMEENQDSYLSSMIETLPSLGGNREWITEDRIYMAPGLEGKEISSTRVRGLISSISAPDPHKKGAGSKQHKGKGKGPDKKIKERLKGLVGEGVRKWVIGEKLYFYKKKPLLLVAEKKEVPEE
ncbi:hypothetical protein SBOR_8745 [Sclerotinia borealis F-4128]|uniref:Nicotinamide-nucleotide adenylyltransferase n=1 Tax=Sclerotinia borealis (strain F-4128) TaxID=1432307 RepID=W9C4U1_SCLBF|nr:hypothetical protein SBOR_8745 [Sclerotinia borealis F-4128]